MSEELPKDLLEKKKEEELLKRQLLQVLEPSAYERLMRVKIANQQLFQQASHYLFQVAPKLGRKITEQELLELLKRLKGPDRETRIQFKRK